MNTPLIHGWLVLDKPVGISSAKAIAIARRLFKTKKAGHTGTLDPAASGVLPIAFGEATKTIPFINNTNKSYEFSAFFGKSTHTDDTEGEILKTSPHRPTQADILTALPHFTGTIQQIPPAVSAIKIGGQRAYALTRSGKTPEMQPRSVTIQHLELREMPSPDEAIMAVDCTSGTYVRSLARDLGHHLGTCAHAGNIRRTRSGGFSLNDTISLEKLESMVHNAPSFEEVQRIVLPLTAPLDGIPVVRITENEGARLKQGQTVRLHTPLPYDHASVTTVCAEYAGNAIALCAYQPPFLKPLRVFNLI
ncbi:MAG: tRNA pseudouridine(55) synthase TruB [Hyphomicrobiales bacterium]|nr:tRNA pseudouridine(55) synthase TruB [Rickettsiales bacterium]MCP5361721.1 tRNA pseudouridine(55) synthase TruB [Hyphomicrobiales bacterium]